MAKLHGNAGSLTFTSLTAGLKSWTLTWDGEVHDITDFADGSVRTFLAGLTTWTATAEGNYDAANTVAPGDSATLTLLTAAATPNYSGTAIVTNVTVSTVVDDVVSASFSFQGSGTLTPAYS